MTVNIGFACKTDVLWREVTEMIDVEIGQLSRLDFSMLGKGNELDFPVVLVDAALLSTAGLEPLRGFCQAASQSQTFVVVLSHSPLENKEISQIYATHVVDVLAGPDVALFLSPKLKRYCAYCTERQKRAETHIYTQQQNELLEFHATHDALTGVYNHLYFQETITDEFATSIDLGTSLGLLMFDLDFFKEVNDSYGHQIGDIVLKEFASLVRDLVPDDCTWCRYGGEEFMLILPEMAQDDVDLLAKAIRLKTEQFVFCTSRSPLKITVSIGGTMVADGIKKVSDFVEEADHALYQAKACGRNCLIWYQPYCVASASFAPSDKCSCVRDRLRATLEKNRSTALASFEAMVHSQTKDYLTLQARNKLALQMVNLLCKRLNLPRNVIQSFRRAFKLHDLLRLFISDSTLEKSGSLSEAEMYAIEDQPLMLKQLTDLFDFFADERMILRYHHEYFDGSGYPEGLDGQDIPMGAKLFTLVDAYVAMILPSYQRPLKKKADIIDELNRLSGVQFDPFLVRLLLDIVVDDGFDELVKEHISRRGD